MIPLCYLFKDNKITRSKNIKKIIIVKSAHQDLGFPNHILLGAADTLYMFVLVKQQRCGF